MPRRREVPALGSLCLQSLVQHMQSLWVRDYSDNHLYEFQFRFVVGPFNDLPGSALQELLRELGESRRLTRAALHLLLLPQLRELRLSPGLASNGIARLLALRCQSLSTLELRGCSRLSAAALETVVEALPRLQRLVLAATQTDQRVLSALGRCCRRLRELDVSHCRNLAPRALRYVAFNPVQRRRCCPALRVLLARGLELAGDGSTAPARALAFLLLALPCLEFLAHGAVPDALRLLHGQELDGAEDADGFPSLQEAARWREAVPGGPRLTLPLRHVEDVEEPDLAVVRAVCPQAEEASVWLSDGTGATELQRWDSLCRLTLGCATGRALAGLVPVVRSLGPCLQSLTLHGFCCHDGLALAAVLAACPGLRAFGAELHLPPDTGTEELDEEPRRCGTDPLAHGCPQLQTFSLTLAGGTGSGLALGPTLGPTLTSLLCHAPHLQHLRLLAIPFPLDPVFQAVLAAPGPPLQELQELSLAGSRVSGRTVRLLLAARSRLHRMDLSRCRDIHRRDYDGFLQSVRKQCLDLDITWE